ncbi:hypothetical protein JCM8097_006253 [Rhodosporidiobolus ruineniae]
MPRLPRALASLRIALAPSSSSSSTRLASTLPSLGRPASTLTPTFTGRASLSTPSATLFRPTALTALTSLHSLRRPTLSPSSSTPLALPHAHPSQQGQQLRTAVYGAEYQPSQVKRKRTHGFLARKRSKTGRRVIARRWGKGRKYLSH